MAKKNKTTTIMNAEKALTLIEDLAKRGRKVLGDLPERSQHRIRIHVPLWPAAGEYHAGLGEHPETIDDIDPDNIPNEIVRFWVAGVELPCKVNGHTTIPEGFVTRAVYYRRKKRSGRLSDDVIYRRRGPITMYTLSEAKLMYGYPEEKR